MIEVRDLSAAHGKQAVFNNLNVRVSEGDFVCLLGPNGCGKTTLLRTLLGLHPKTSGQVLLRGSDMAALSAKQQARLISYVPQYHRTAFGYPVIDMVLMGVMAAYSEWAVPTVVHKDLALAALTQMNIAHLKDRPYTELSGGQRQLVLIARALAQDTPYLFMDEPTNGLDYGNQIKLLERIRDLADHKRCIVMTTHHPEQAMMVANRVLTMQNGALLQDGVPSEVITKTKMAQLYDLALHQIPKFSFNHDGLNFRQKRHGFGWAK